jgi:hypothetical protein
LRRQKTIVDFRIMHPFTYVSSAARVHVLAARPELSGAGTDVNFVLLKSNPLAGIEVLGRVAMVVKEVRVVYKRLPVAS